MASNQTSNYGLNQWEATDQVLRTDFNADNSKIDAALKGLANKDTELEAMISAATAASGNCEMELITYTGTGTYGTEHPTRVQFADLPEVFFIVGGKAMLLGQGGSDQMMLIASNMFNETFINATTHSWSGGQLTLVDSSNARYQMNGEDTAYWVLGLRRKGLQN